ncbi:MAG: peptidoglycan-associated lipoprotein [Sphingomonas sp. SCN 67-18]|uniref:peptidoglycan-associated lipoprotein Pal n=1 Tax=uncultured Sphingomonas sp. TaxID=158754 RepID=UPI00086EE3A7|nr:peptidoglycan-associated lipoprotein Pal [Sphingomonas sp. SCN 67-18]ODU22231.1 MAG: peptidoglycan-associated lipoprotein [Sphingomonas sp. SCN 67-18]
MLKTTKLILAGAALVAVAGCAKKAPEQIPPAPQQSTQPPETTPAPPAQVQTGPVPGSREDFLAKVSADRVLFATDSSDIDSQARSILDSQAAWLNQYPNVRITIEGHADERGTREYNLALGDRRANSAKNYLAAAGVAASRITTISYGKERPEALGSDESAWAQNRRAVTVTLH